ncbi:MAG: hypothetical protein FJ102_26690, partial [Deltaproteobacteria bacterium]|nr:hypothetical protein [Deltaproteobacteria bacterium]
ADGGFGARLASDGTRAWVAAPWACAVHAVDPGEAPVTIFEGPRDTFCGLGLAPGLWGAPGNGGALYASTTALATGSQLGGVIAGNADAWVASTATGYRDQAGRDTTLGTRPDALLLDGTAGAAHGDVSVWVDGVPEPRTTPGDERGYALARCDADGDGDTELIVGVPGLGLVEIDGVPVGPGTGRFGASLACGSPGTIYAGAPAAGALHHGAAYAITGGTAVEVATGNELDELGTALAVASGHLLVGAPGPAASPGRVVVIALE